MNDNTSTNFILGETRLESKTNTAEEIKDTAIRLVQQSRYSIDIFSQNMESEIYNNKEIEQAIFELAKRHPSTRVRILVHDSKKAAHQGHCLMRLSQMLTSSVFIHNPSVEHKDVKSAFMIADRLGFLYRVTTTDRNYHASFNFMSPQRAAELSDLFTEIWEHSTPDMQTRRLYV